MAKKEKPAELADEKKFERGQLLDDLHARMRYAQKHKLALDPEINDKAQQLSECVDPAHLAEIASWHATLTPLAQLPKVQTWEEADQLAAAVRTKILQEAQYFQLMNQAPPAALKDLLLQLESVRKICFTPEAAILQLEGMNLQLRIALDKHKAKGG